MLNYGNDYIDGQSLSGVATRWAVEADPNSMDEGAVAFPQGITGSTPGFQQYLQLDGLYVTQTGTVGGPNTASPTR